MSPPSFFTLDHPPQPRRHPQSDVAQPARPASGRAPRNQCVIAQTEAQPGVAVPSLIESSAPNSNPEPQKLHVPAADEDWNIPPPSYPADMASEKISEKSAEYAPFLEQQRSPLRKSSSSRNKYTKVAACLFVGFVYLLANCYVFPTLERSYVTQATSSQPPGRIPLKTLEELMIKTPDPQEARKHLQWLTSGPHIGGQNRTTAEYVQEQLKKVGIPDVEIVAYDIYTNYPKGHRLALLNETGSEDEKNYDLLFEASLEEDVLEEDPTTGLENRVPTFHGYSASGNVTAEYVFANYATFQDFEDLQKKNFSVAGKVVLCKYGKIFRGLKVKRAQELGAVGVLMYSDPGDDGEVTELNGYKPYPEGPARNPSSVQRGSVQFLSIGPGDPQTPGYPSLPGVPRQDPGKFLPKIPSLPISYADALPLLKALNGHGMNPDDLGGDWGNGGLWHKDVKYNVGPAPGIVVNLFNDQEYVVTPQWDVIGKIPGHIPDEVVILGNHRDAWIAGGAGDPNSGTAAMIEVARTFGRMMELGWKPMRTIVFGSWDGEEYGLLGSTEWVEDKKKWLKAHALTYLNVDVAATTPIIDVAANPLLQNVIHAALQKVGDPRSQDNGTDKTVFDVWNKHIATLGSGSDYTAFQDHLGIPSVDMGFAGYDPKAPIYHYHSNYDSFYWMDKFGDPGFKYHTASAQLWGLMTLHLTESPVVPFNATAYASGLLSYLEKIRTKLDDATGLAYNTTSKDGDKDKPEHPPNNPHDPDHRPPPPPPPGKPDHPKPPHPPHGPHHPHRPTPADPRLFRHALCKLHHETEKFLKKAIKHDKYAAELAEQLADPDTPWWKRIPLLVKARVVNKKYQYLDRAFVYEGGLDDREWFKHVVYAPGVWTGYAGDTFPGLVESIDAKNWTNAVRWSKIIGRSVKLAESRL